VVLEMQACNIFTILWLLWTGQGKSVGNSGAASVHGMSKMVYRVNSDAYRQSNSTRSFPRTVDGVDITFDTEPKLPKLHNLAGHVTECKGTKDDKKRDEPTSEEQINIKRSAEVMEAYLKEGELNPEVVATYRGFLRIFSAWILDESLPWTTGESPTLQMLFRYLKITYQLPSDTTVRNQLAHIFEELHGKVVREFAVSSFSLKALGFSFSEFFQAVKSKIAYATDTWTTPQMVYTFACSIGCFINDDWEIIERVIDFKPLEDKEHEGLYGGKAFVDGACKIGSFDKISFTCDCARSNCLPPSRLHCISISTDNASVNDIIIVTIAGIRLARYEIWLNMGYLHHPTYTFAVCATLSTSWFKPYLPHLEKQTTLTKLTTILSTRSSHYILTLTPMLIRLS
jgi:hypothetical protein